MEIAEKPRTRAVRPGGRSRFPDDPSVRVDLAESFRRDLEGQGRAQVAEKVFSPGRDHVLHPSSVSRYLRGRVSPTLLVARRLAAAAGRPLAEAVVAYSGRYGRPTERWAKEMFYARPFRGRVFAFLEMFNNVLGYVHFGFPTDRERGWRRVVRPQHDRPEYAYFEIIIEEPPDQAVPFDFILAYQLFERPAVFIDYGRISLAKPTNRPPDKACQGGHPFDRPPYQGGPRGVEALLDLPLSPSLARREDLTPSGTVHGQPEGHVSDASTDSTVEVSGFELWTRRSHSERTAPGASRIWVQTWIDGKATDFVVRSRHPFTLGPMISAEELPAGPLVIIPFHPGGMHRYAPAGA